MTDLNIEGADPWMTDYQRRIDTGKAAATQAWFHEACTDIATCLAAALERLTEGEAWEQVEKVGLETSLCLETTCAALRERLPAHLVDGMYAIAAAKGEEPEIEWLWGSAVARAMITTPEHCFEACGLIGERFVALEAATEALAQALKGSQREAVVSGLGKIVSRIAEHPEYGAFRRDREGLRQYFRGWQTQENIQKLWDRHIHEISWDGRSLGVLHSARQVDRAMFLDLLEQTTFPPALDWIFYSREIAGCLDEILALLEAAPLCQKSDERGRPCWNGKMTAPILLMVALHHAEPRPGAQESVGRAELDDQAAEIFSRLAAVLIAREDGRFLCSQWLAHLIGEEKRFQLRSPDHWMPFQSAIDILSEAMAAKGWGHADIQEVFPDLTLSAAARKTMRQSGVGEKARGWETSDTDAFLAAVLLEEAESQKNGPPNVAALLALYDDLLIRRDQGLYAYADAVFPSWRHWYPAAIYKELPDPLGAWKQSWSALVEQRRRALHSVNDTGADDASFFHLCLGISLVDWLLNAEEPDRRDLAEVCWQAVFNAAFCMCLTLRWRNADRWRHALAKLFARLPHIARVSQSGNAAEVVAIELARLGGDDEMLTWCTSMALLNQVEISDLAAALQSQKIDFLSRLGAFADWEERTGKRTPRSPLAEEARKILRAAKS